MLQDVAAAMVAEAAANDFEAVLCDVEAASAVVRSLTEVIPLDTAFMLDLTRLAGAAITQVGPAVVQAAAVLQMVLPSPSLLADVVAAQPFYCYVRSQPRELAFGILTALYDDDRERVDAYLQLHLHLKPTPERREALWRVLERRRWLQVEPDRLSPYLAVAVYQEANRIQRDRELADRIWGRWGAPLLDPDLRLINPGQDPLLVLLRREKAEEQWQALRRVLQTGTPGERLLVARLIAGDTPARAVDAAGVGWSGWQALQRRARKALSAVFGKNT